MFFKISGRRLETFAAILFANDQVSKTAKHISSYLKKALDICLRLARILGLSL